MTEKLDSDTLNVADYETVNTYLVQLCDEQSPEIRSNQRDKEWKREREGKLGAFGNSERKCLIQRVVLKNGVNYRNFMNFGNFQKWKPPKFVAIKCPNLSLRPLAS